MYHLNFGGSGEGLGLANGAELGFGGGALKRRRTEEEEMYPHMFPVVRTNYPQVQIDCVSTGRTFLSIQHNSHTYHTEEWKPRGCTMYLPLREDILINTRNIEQISFEVDQFFLADDKGNYVGAKPVHDSHGNALHLWRFDPSCRKLYISRSVLFLREMDYRVLQNQLEQL
ncbi:hypothetical protein LAZ67_3001842 [Cordylochernes scorpioides]|uniref:Uncharacterized protein n=1 Tax=Cordylochernes scorpioides TaxID=51811 RepID=A0ABY6KAK8_9ARAC|nr:hypothetical protein LAZ67_3001842 [Cordylochernes scorpioides]